MSTNPFSVVESVIWQRDDGRTASTAGACPWTSDAERARWTRRSVGWTTYDSSDGTTGHGHQSLPTRDEAQVRADRWNARIAESAALHRAMYPESYEPKAQNARKARA